MSAINNSDCCPYQQASLLQQALAPDKMRVGFFLGAGCPVSVRDNGEALIPAVAELTKKICQSLKSGKYKACLDAILKRLADSGEANPNIEIILSHIRALHDVIGKGKIDGVSKTELEELDKEICAHITSIVEKPLPSDDTPYHNLAKWIRGIKRAHPVEIFTSNYDLLMEQALEECQVPYFDGFVGSRNAFFDLTSIEQENLPARWTRLWKVHGSVNWWRNSKKDVERREKGKGEDRQMIYPSHIKYYQSRRMPYFAMLDRLRSFLGQGQAILVTCGYSFSDQHLNEIIKQGLSSNPTAVCFGLLFEEKSKYPEAIQCARQHPNLSLLALDGSVLGMTQSEWRNNQKIEHPLHELAVNVKEANKDKKEECEFILGNFKSFGDFLAKQITQNDMSESFTDGS